MTSGVVIGLLSVSSIAHANPDDGSSSDLSDLLASIEDPSGEAVGEGSLESQAETSFLAEDGSETEIIVGDDGEVSFAAAGNPGFSIRFSDVTEQLAQTGSAEPLAYEAGDESSIVPQILDRHFRGIFVLDSAAASNVYSVELAGSEGAVPILAEDGGVIISDSRGAPIGGFLAPWAQDSLNRPVPTYFMIDGQEVRQIIDTSDLNAGDYPVVADPATYIDVTTSTVINRVNHGNVPKYSYKNQCTAAKGKTCSISRSYTVTGTAQGALNMSASAVAGSLGFSISQGVAVGVTCGVSKGPGTVTLYGSADRLTYQVRSVRTYGVSPKYKTETRTSGTLTAYKPNGRYFCA